MAKKKQQTKRKPRLPYTRHPRTSTSTAPIELVLANHSTNQPKSHLIRRHRDMLVAHCHSQPPLRLEFYDISDGGYGKKPCYSDYYNSLILSCFELGVTSKAALGFQQLVALVPGMDETRLSVKLDVWRKKRRECGWPDTSQRLKDSPFDTVPMIFQFLEDTEQPGDIESCEDKETSESVELQDKPQGLHNNSGIDIPSLLQHNEDLRIICELDGLEAGRDDYWIGKIIAKCFEDNGYGENWDTEKWEAIRLEIQENKK